MQNKVELVPRTIYLDKTLIEEIEKMAEEKMWKFSPMAYVLLQSAVKEKNRKKNATTKNNS